MVKTPYRGRGRPRKTDVRKPDGSKKIKTTKARTGKSRPKREKKSSNDKFGGGRNKVSIESYVHENEKRKNIPETGLFANFKENDRTKQYRYDPNEDPILYWAGKVERQEFEVNTVPLHKHERVDPMTVVLNITKPDLHQQSNIMDFFDDEERKLPYSKAIDFYKHEYDWSNRIIAGDSLDIMNSLLEKEGMEGKVKMIYIDPPYGINYNSNFQTGLSRGSSGDKDENLSKDPKTIKAFRDTWELGIHSYLTYIRDRIYLSHTLLRGDGSIFVQISDANVHRIRLILDEVFGADNFVAQISFKKTTQSTSNYLSSVFDIILWYARDKRQFKPNKLFHKRTQEEIDEAFPKLDIGNGRYVGISKREKYPNARQFRLGVMFSNHHSETRSKPYTFKGKQYHVPKGSQWRVSFDVMDALTKKGRLVAVGNNLRFKGYYDDFPFTEFTNIWTDTLMSGFNSEKIYVVQTYSKVIQRCILMATNPGDLVLDPTCGAGTTAVVAEQFGRRWITCDTSQVAISLARMRIISTVFDYYKLESEEDGVCSGFQYETVERKTKKSIAGMVGEDESEDDEIHKAEILYDRPLNDPSKKRVSGPFTLESISPPVVESLDVIHASQHGDTESSHMQFQDNWRTALKQVGVSGRVTIKFQNMELHPKSKWIHAVGLTIDSKRVAVSFGPEYGTMDTRQIQYTREEIRMLNEEFDIVIFAAMQFDPAVHDEMSNLNSNQAIQEKIYIVDINKDLMNRDLKSPKSDRSATFWMIGQPDIGLEKEGSQYVVEVKGFDYMNPKTGEMKSGGTENIAMWSLDTNYDGRCMYPRQIFFPISGSVGEKLYKKMLNNLKAVIDKDKLESYKGTRSLPFTPKGEAKTKGKKIAVKIIDEAGRETLRVLDID